MFRPRREPTAAEAVAVLVEGRTVRVPQGASAAAALLAAGWRSFRETPAGGVARGPWCLVGVCFDCLVEIDGVPNRQSCLVTVRPGMQIRCQHGARSPLPFPPPRAGEG